VDGASGTDGERDEPLSSQEAAGEGAVVAAAASSKGGKGKGKQNVVAAVPAARPIPKRPAKPLVWYDQYSTELTVAAVVLVLLVLVYLAFTSN
jgi:flagellar biosynthesis/type III secretory pathway M-ring protein FliF/YscJ